MEHFYEKIQGWFDYQDLYKLIVNKLPNGSHIVEVGAWKGRSTAYLAVEIINSGKNIKLDVVDLWTGELKDPTAFNTDAEFMAYNRDILPLFKKNLASVLHILTPIQMPSVEASKLYQDKSLDFVYIDANHDYENVLEDIKVWLPKVKEDGIISGHDYNHISFPGVIKAVHEVFSKDKIEFLGGCSWTVQLD
jgi:cephalosporin hydroxylase